MTETSRRLRHTARCKHIPSARAWPLARARAHRPDQSTGAFPPRRPRRHVSERNPYEAPATEETYAATSWICCSDSWPENDGITPLPWVTRSTTRDAGGFASSRFGPTVPVAPASASVWHEVQPADSKTCLPAVASPEGSAGVVGVVSPPPPPPPGGWTSAACSASASWVCAAQTTVVI